MAQNSASRPPRRLEACRVGIVVGVPSGDTLTILEPDRTTPGSAPATVNLTLTGVKAPLLGKRVIRDGKTVVERDERWAWDSREELRQRVIGRSVVFRVQHAAGPRSYGEVWADQVSIRHVLVQEGWLDVSSKATAPADPELEALKEKAKAAERGIWNTEKKGAVRNVTYWEGGRERSQEIFGLFERIKNKPLRAVVDQVRTGTTLRVILLPTHDNVQLQLAGVRSPGFNGTDAEAYALEARFFTEYLLNNRDVTVTIEGIDKQSNLFGTVVDTAGRNISINLLRAGLANIVDWSASPKSDMKALREAERLAQEERLRIWKDHKAKATGPQLGPETESVMGKVVEVISGSVILVRLLKGDEERRITLSSVQVPRFGGRQEEETTTQSEQDRLKSEEERRLSYLANEAKEFVRKALVGRTVRCVLDYSRQADSKGPARSFYSVYNKEKNVAVDLVAAGLATVVPHGAQEARSRDFQAMLIAEKSAQKAALGVHAPKSKISVPRVVDLTNSEAAKSQPFLSTLKRNGRIAAVVDFVFSGTRFKLNIPSEGLVVTLVLQGLAADRVQRAAVGKKQQDLTFSQLYPPNTPANKAFHLARDKFFQKDVQVEIDSVDKGGNFVGTILAGGQPWGLELVEQGLAKVHHPSAQRMKGYPTLKEAEEEAKKARLGVWHDYDPAVEAAKQAEYLAAREAARGNVTESAKINVTVTDILDGGTFWFQQVGDQTRALEDLMSQMQAVNFQDQPSITPAKGDIVAGRFTIDDAYYRAEVQRVIEGEKPQYQVLYVDYGNVEVLDGSRVKALPAQFSLNVLPRQAQLGKLAFIKAASIDSEFGVDAAAMLKELVWDKPLVATIQFKEGQGAQAVSYLSLGDPETKVPINAALVMAGLARVQKSRTRSAFYERLKEEEEKARKQRLSIWQYGDLPDSDDERA